MKIPFAAVSWPRGTTNGITLSSAGAKNVVAMETIRLSRRITPTFVPTNARRRKRTARTRLVATSTSRRSNRSTYTPASAPKMTAGARKLMSRMETALLEPDAVKTRTVRPYRTMLPPTWVATCESQRIRNGRFRKTASAGDGSSAMPGRPFTTRRPPGRGR